MANDKVDPIRDRYFAPLNRAEIANDVLFVGGAIVSLAIFFVEKAQHPSVYNALQGVFIASIIAIWIMAVAIRLYFAPRAQARRFEDFLSNAFGVPLSGHEATTGYYHTHARGVAAVGAQLLENALHSKDTALCMAWLERGKASTYLVLLLVAVLSRATDLSLVAIIAQAIFSEQLLSRYIRTEWMRRSFESVYKELYSLFQTKAGGPRFEALVWSLVIEYESAKAVAGVTLTGWIFERRNEVVSAEWQKVRALLGI